VTVFHYQGRKKGVDITIPIKAVMKEVDTSEHDTLGHLKLGSDDVLQNLYRIFTHFYGSARLTELASLDTGARFQNLRERYEELEIQRLLLTVAIRIRILDDAYREKWNDSTADWTVDVGEFFEDSTTEASVPLSLREACNKIIHARWLNFIRTEEDPKGGHIFPLVPTVAIYGTRPRSTTIWKAKLQIDGFVDSAAAVTELI